VDRAYKPGKGGIVVLDDGDIEDDLGAEKDAYLALMEMPDIDDNVDDLDGGDEESEGEEDDSPSHAGQKRKSWSDQGEDEHSEEEGRPRQRRRSNSVCPPSTSYQIGRLTISSVESYTGVPFTAGTARAYVYQKQSHLLKRPARSAGSGSPTSEGDVGEDIET
jgi:hypothetical protein